MNCSSQLTIDVKQINISLTHNWKGGQVYTTIKMMKESHYEDDMALPTSLLFLKLGP